MQFVRVLKASNWKVEKISETDWVIKSPDGIYKDSDGKDYHFKTKEDALEELDYLRAEHKFDKKSSHRNRNDVTFDAIDGGLVASIRNHPYYGFAKANIRCFSGGSNGDYAMDKPLNYDDAAQLEDMIAEELNYLAHDVDKKVIEIMKKYGFEKQ